MINKFHVLYVGQIELDNIGLDGTPANDRRYSDERLREVFATARDVAQIMDELGYRRAVDRRASFPARGLRGLPEPDPARPVARDADQAAEVRLRASTCCRCGTRSAWPRTTRWPTSSPTAASIMGVGRGYHTREVETLRRAAARRREEPRALRGAAAAPAEVLQRGAVPSQGQVLRGPPPVRVSRLQAQGHHLVPRPKHLPVEIWMPIASGKTIDMMAQYGLKAMVTLNGEKILDDVVRAYHDACAQARPAEAARRGHDLGRRASISPTARKRRCAGSSRRTTSATSGSRRSASCATPTSRAAPGARPARRRRSRRCATASQQKAWFCGPPKRRHRRHQVDRGEISRASTDFMIHWAEGLAPEGVQGAAALVRQGRDAGVQGAMTPPQT